MTYFIIEDETQFLMTMYKNNTSSPFLSKEKPGTETYSTITKWCNVNWLLKDKPVYDKYQEDGKSPIFIIDENLGVTGNGILYSISEDCFLFTSAEFDSFCESLAELLPGLCETLRNEIYNSLPTIYLKEDIEKGICDAEFPLFDEMIKNRVLSYVFH